MTTPTKEEDYQALTAGASDGTDEIERLDNSFEDILRSWMKTTPQNRGKSIRQRITNPDTWDKYTCLIGTDPGDPLGRNLDAPYKSFFYGNGYTGTDASSRTKDAKGIRPSLSESVRDEWRWTNRHAITQGLMHVPDDNLEEVINLLSIETGICDGIPGCLIEEKCGFDINSTDNLLCKEKRLWAINCFNSSDQFTQYTPEAGEGTPDACNALKIRFDCAQFYNGALSFDVYAEHTEDFLDSVDITLNVAGYDFTSWAGYPSAEYIEAAAGVDVTLGPESGGLRTATFNIKEETKPLTKTEFEGDEFRLGKIWIRDVGGSNTDKQMKITGTYGYKLDESGVTGPGGNYSFAICDEALPPSVAINTSRFELLPTTLSGWGCHRFFYLVPLFQFPNWMSYIPLVTFNAGVDLTKVEQIVENDQRVQEAAEELEDLLGVEDVIDLKLTPDGDIDWEVYDPTDQLDQTAIDSIYATYEEDLQTATTLRNELEAEVGVEVATTTITEYETIYDSTQTDGTGTFHGTEETLTFDGGSAITREASETLLAEQEFNTDILDSNASQTFTRI